MKPIYKPTGRAGEYGDYALNIYTGCNHGCVYCYAAKNAKRWGKDFTHVEPRPGIIEATKRQLENIKGKTIHLCFTCDPYPAEVDTTVTRKIIKTIKDSGNHVQILTKGDGSRDFDLLDGNDWFGITLTGATWEQEPGATRNISRLLELAVAKSKDIKTWVSFEPVMDEQYVLSCIAANSNIFDMIKIGKLNHFRSDINWGEFGRECERLCKLFERNYYIKEDLRREMEKS